MRLFDELRRGPTSDRLRVNKTGSSPALQEDVMRLGLVAMAAALFVGGCSTTVGVQKTGVVWSGVYSARYDQLASCISAHTTPYYKATLQLDRNQQRATVTYLVPVTNIAVEVYELRQRSDDATEISWSSRLEGGRHVGTPYLMSLCGASPLPASALPANPATAPPHPPSPAWAPEPQ
jgi:hypothetical protein